MGSSVVHHVQYIGFSLVWSDLPIVFRHVHSHKQYRRYKIHSLGTNTGLVYIDKPASTCHVLNY